MTNWYTSDIHYMHLLVAQLRGFDSPEEMNDTIATNWRRRVRKDDHVFVLGDLAVRQPEAALDWLATLPGIKHFIAGNHDPVHPMHRDAHTYQQRYLQVFASVQPFMRKRFSFDSERHDVLLSHFPYSSDRGAVRYTQWRLRDEGAWLLHGHTHDHQRLHDEHEIHVGLDAWNLNPVSQNDLIDLMR